MGNITLGEPKDNCITIIGLHASFCRDYQDIVKVTRWPSKLKHEKLKLFRLLLGQIQWKHERLPWKVHHGIFLTSTQRKQGSKTWCVQALPTDHYHHKESMKHSFVSYRSNGQFCRAVLEVALLLVISICLVQQIKTLSMKQKSHYQSSYRPSEESKIIGFGRKGTLEYTVGAKTNFQGGNDMEEYQTAEDRGAGDDELDWNEEYISMVLKPEEEEEQEETQVGDEEDMELMKANYGLDSIPMAEKKESDVPSWFINDIVIGSDNPEDVDRSQAFQFQDENGIPPDGIELLMSR
ncbi:hypothetical protein K2173_024452 [Erythroxylum novogranatense]|uniref:Uncharacterized protein n=1 Tax=Erythroxylum novogranatense TaxID=1862640 RepID=A0AAV8SUD1_9ROSI|nr:hypothetical protein K2173_024452 [Erythroxylum novogranatense]